MSEYAGDTQINILTRATEMDGWYIRPSCQGQHILTWSTDSINSSVSSTWSTALIKLAKVSTAMIVVMGAGLLYMEYLHRLKLIRREEARQRRLVRKLLERQRMNMDPVPIYQVKKKIERNDPDHVIPPDLVCRNQLYRVWGAVPPARQLWRQRKRADGGRSGRRRGGERDVHYMDLDRGDPDGGDDSINNDDPSMDEVIQSAKEVRRLIRESSAHSLSHDDLQSGNSDIPREDITHYDEQYSEDNQDYLSKTNTDFRELLQLTSIDDNWSDTRSIRQSPVISFSSQPRQTRRQSVLSCSSASLMDQEGLYWEDEAPMELGGDGIQNVDLVIRCGEIVTLDTNIKMK